MAKHEHTAVKDPREAIVEWCQARRADIGQMTGTPPDDFDTADIAVIWDALDQFHRELGVWVRDWATELGHRIDGRTIDTPAGPLTSEQRRTVKWDGDRILTALEHEMMDMATGELEAVVRVDTLRAVLPAVGAGQTSSRWKQTGLKQLLGDRYDRYMDIEYGPPLPKRVT